jgi:hypothetical protein
VELLAIAVFGAKLIFGIEPIAFMQAMLVAAGGELFVRSPRNFFGRYLNFCRLNRLGSRRDRNDCSLLSRGR